MHPELQLYPSQPMRIYEVPPNLGPPWIVQIKKNGHRAIVRCVGPDDPVCIYSRHGDPLTAAKGRDWDWLKDVFVPPFVLDGELVGPRQAGSEHRLCLWDMILHDGESMLAWPYLQWKIAITEMSPVSAGLSCETYPFERWQELWDSITDPDGPDEGLVFKRADVAIPWHPRPNVESALQLKLRKKG
jgi:hypothetical protein